MLLDGGVGRSPQGTQGRARPRRPCRRGESASFVTLFYKVLRGFASRFSAPLPAPFDRGTAKSAEVARPHDLPTQPSLGAPEKSATLRALARAIRSGASFRTEKP